MTERHAGEIVSHNDAMLITLFMLRYLGMVPKEQSCNKSEKILRAVVEKTCLLTTNY